MRSFLQICSHLLKKSLMKIFFFRAVIKTNVFIYNAKMDTNSLKQVAFHYCIIPT